MNIYAEFVLFKSPGLQRKEIEVESNGTFEAVFIATTHKRKWEYSKFISRHYYFITACTRLNRPLNTRSGLDHSMWFQPLFTDIVPSYSLAKWFVLCRLRPYLAFSINREPAASSRSRLSIYTTIQP
jgi:hypothetical protein